MSDFSLEQFRAMRNALKRLASMEAFDTPRVLREKEESELSARIDYARGILKKLDL